MVDFNGAKQRKLNHESQRSPSSSSSGFQQTSDRGIEIFEIAEFNV